MINRKDLERLLGQANNHSVSIIIGARQVGKSTLLGMIREKLGAPSETFNLENPLHLALFNEGYTSFIRTIRTNLIFIDEFQYCKGISSVFKAVYDLNPSKNLCHRLISMKSGSSERKSLAGRNSKRFSIPLPIGMVSREDISEDLTFFRYLSAN